MTDFKHFLSSVKFTPMKGSLSWVPVVQSESAEPIKARSTDSFVGVRGETTNHGLVLVC